MHRIICLTLMGIMTGIHIISKILKLTVKIPLLVCLEIL